MTKCLHSLEDCSPDGWMLPVVSGRQAWLLGPQQATGLCVWQGLSQYT